MILGFEQTFSEHRKRLKQKKMSESLCKINVVIDMSFESLMNQKDLGKCLKQLLHCYSINRRLSHPLQFHISSFDGDRLKKEMERHQGYENWDCMFHTDSYFDVFTKHNNSMKCEDTSVPDGTNDIKVEAKNDKVITNKKDISLPQQHSPIPTDSNEKENCVQPNKKHLLVDPKQIVYLTSESDNVLETFDTNSVYIIGGLVDHNNHKGICHRLALEKGVSHARFPIQEAGIEMKTRQVLTIDHVFRIIAAVASEGKSWKEGLMETLPNRKGAKEVLEHDQNNEKVSDNDEKNLL